MACERYQNLSDGEKEKSKNMDVNNIKNFLKMVKKGWLSIRKFILKR